MNILILNAGSSSIKFQLIDMPSAIVRCSGLVERIGQEDAVFNFKSNQSEISQTKAIPSHKVGLEIIVNQLLDSQEGVIKSKEEIDAVGHRVVHGGKTYSDTTIISSDVKEKIKELSSLAPLHNPHNLEGIHIAEKLFPAAKQIAVFDTAFHQSIPEKAKKYAIPNNFYEEFDIQLYGFHGTSHKYVTAQAIEYLKLKRSKMISIHLGNGCSMTAVLNGKSVDHSLGFAPGNGLIMGSRSGDIDHALIFHLVQKLGYSLESVERLLTKESGMLGLTGFSDLRDIQREAAAGNEDCKLALEMNSYRIKKYIGSYIAAMNGLDAILFTAGIGENSSMLREMVCADMDYLGIELDIEKNEQRSKTIREIQSAQSKTKILVIPTNEELEIAQQAFNVIS